MCHATGSSDRIYPTFSGCCQWAVVRDHPSSAVRRPASTRGCQSSSSALQLKAALTCRSSSPSAMARKSAKASGADGSSADGSTRISRRPRAAAAAEPVSAHSAARLGMLSGLIEGTLAVLELMVGLSLSRFACVFIYKTLNSLEQDQQPPAWNLFCITVVSNLIVLSWQVYRLSQKSQPVCSIGTMANRLNLWPFPRRLSSDTLSMLSLVFVLHAVGTAGMFLAQHLSGQWIFGWGNYWSDEEGGWRYNNALDMLLLAPLREELTFRGLMFSIFYLRGAAYKLAPPLAADGTEVAPLPAAPGMQQESLAWTSRWKLECVAASAVTFGLVHLLNAFGAKYTKTYIVLQVVLGMILGAFYCMRLVLSDNTLLEPIALHVINNAFSSFLPIEADLDLSNPMVSFPLLLTFVVYGSLGLREYRKLVALPPQPFTVLLPQGDEQFANGRPHAEPLPAHELKQE